MTESELIPFDAAYPPAGTAKHPVVPTTPYEPYRVIMADPPWQYGFSRSKSRAIERQYPTMTVDQICALAPDVPAARNSFLLLWATAPKLREALWVMDSWNFEYKTHAIWDKVTVGMGYWFRGQHELLLVGVRGKISPPAASLRIPSIVREKRSSKHSQKTRQFQQYVDRAYPGVRKLEMFARTEYAGWDVWGNEVKTEISIPSACALKASTLDCEQDENKEES